MDGEYDLDACTELQCEEREVLEVCLGSSLFARGSLTEHIPLVDPPRLPVYRGVERHYQA